MLGQTLCQWCTWKCHFLNVFLFLLPFFLWYNMTKREMALWACPPGSHFLSHLEWFARTPVMWFSGFQVVCLDTSMPCSLAGDSLHCSPVGQQCCCSGTPVPRTEFVEGLQDTSSSAGLLGFRRCCFPLGCLVWLKWVACMKCLVWTLYLLNDKPGALI